MLTLNAAIEDARARNARRGFSVVADDVRRLTNGPAEATAEIASILDEDSVLI